MPHTASWKWHHWWSVTQLRTDRSLYYPGYQKTVSRPPPPPPLYLLVHNLSSHPNFPPYISNKKFLSLQLNSFVCSQWEILIESLQNFQSSVFEPLQTAHFSDEKFIEPNCRLEVQLNRKREIEAQSSSAIVQANIEFYLNLWICNCTYSQYSPCILNFILTYCNLYFVLYIYYLSRQIKNHIML